VASIVYPINIYYIFNDIVQAVEPYIPHVSQNYEQKKWIFISVLLGYYIGFSALAYLLCIRISHRVAGPIYKLNNYLKDFGTITEAQPLYFRKGDYFLEIPASLNAALARLQDRVRHQQNVLDEINHTLSELSTQVDDSKKPVLQDVCRKLSSLENI